MTQTIVLEEYAKQRSRRVGLLKKYGITILFLFPFLAAFIVFFIIPLFYGVYISLTNYIYDKPGVETFNTFLWFKIIFDPTVSPLIYDNFWLSFLHTLMFAIIMVPIAILLPLFLAIIINKKPPGFKLFRALIYMPSIVPLTAAGTIFTLIFLNDYGVLASLFGNTTNWLSGDDALFSFILFGKEIKIVYQWVPIFFMCLWGGWGGNFIILSAGLQNVPKHLYEAAAIDGCNAWKRTMNVTIPGIKPQLVLCLFTTIIGYMGLYGQNYVLTAGGPGITGHTEQPAGGYTSTIMYFIQDLVLRKADPLWGNFFGLSAAASLVFALFTGILSGIQMLVTREKKTGTKISEAYSKWHTVR